MTDYYIHDSKSIWTSCTDVNNTLMLVSTSNSSATHNVLTKSDGTSKRTAIEIQDYISHLQSYIFQYMRNNNKSFDDATTSTLAPSDSNPPYRGKPLCQLVADLNNLINTFNSVIGSYDMNNSSIYKKYDENNELRNNLQKNIDMIYGKETNSKLYLDSTVYTSVLWTILATTIIFYIFKKL